MQNKQRTLCRNSEYDRQDRGRRNKSSQWRVNHLEYGDMITLNGNEKPPEKINLKNVD